MTHTERLKETEKQEKLYINQGKEEYNQAFDEMNKEIALFTSEYGVDGHLDNAEAQKYDRQKKLEKTILSILGAVTIMNVGTFGAYTTGQYEFNFKAEKAIIERLTKKAMKYTPKARKELITELLTGLDRVALLNNNQQLKTKVARAVSQGMVQGKTAKQTSSLVKDAMNSNAKNALRIVRTETTKAMNKGLLDSMEESAKRGIELEKEWIKNPVKEPRANHTAIDGERQPLDKPFSIGLMFAGDPSADASEVINCTCTMVEVLKD